MLPVGAARGAVGKQLHAVCALCVELKGACMPTVVVFLWRLQVLLEAGIKTADAVVLGSGPPVGAELEADARILSAVLQVRQQTAVWACAVTAADRLPSSKPVCGSVGQLVGNFCSHGCLGRKRACVQCLC